MAVGKVTETLQAPLSTDTAPSSSAQEKCDRSPDVSKLHEPEAATLEKSVSTEPLQPEPPFPEGGLQAWLVVFGAWAGL